MDCDNCIYHDRYYSEYPCNECVHSELIWDYYKEKEEVE